jgi:hypothetical protein
VDPKSPLEKNPPIGLLPIMFCIQSFPHSFLPDLRTNNSKSLCSVESNSSANLPTVSPPQMTFHQKNDLHATSQDPPQNTNNPCPSLYCRKYSPKLDVKALRYFQSGAQIRHSLVSLSNLI